MKTLPIAQAIAEGFTPCSIDSHRIERFTNDIIPVLPNGCTGVIEVSYRDEEGGARSFEYVRCLIHCPAKDITVAVLLWENNKEVRFFDDATYSHVDQSDVRRFTDEVKEPNKVFKPSTGAVAAWIECLSAKRAILKAKNAENVAKEVEMRKKLAKLKKGADYVYEGKDSKHVEIEKNGLRLKVTFDRGGIYVTVDVAAGGSNIEAFDLMTKGKFTRNSK